MVKNKKSVYICQTCSYESTGWLGKCPDCNSWGSLVETFSSTKSSKRPSSARGSGGVVLDVVKLSSVSTKAKSRVSTKIPEFDRVLGGGIVAGQVILLAGDPGIGKSTILTQLSDSLGNIIYVSGEESAYQVALRAKRLGAVNPTTQILEETNIDNILETLHRSDLKKLKCVIVDSIQTMSTGDLSGMAGSVGQVRECSYRLTRFAKDTGIPVIIVGHVTKQGSVAGPAQLMHLVDTVLWFEGANDLIYRMLRARKNRFGPTDEVGIFTMENKGLISVTDASHLFVSDLKESVPGSCRAIIMEGTRPIIVEIQSLIIRSKLAFSKRVAQGIDSKRLELLLAILERRAGIALSDYDVFVNVVGGIKVKEAGSDLAICLSLASSFYDKALPQNISVCGEVGLLGEVRKVPTQEKRIKEAKRLGYKKIISAADSRYLRSTIKSTFDNLQAGRSKS